MAAFARTSRKATARRRFVPKETPMDKLETAIAVFPNHDAAEGAVKTLTAAGFAMKCLSVVGKGYHSEEKVVGFYTTGGEASAISRPAETLRIELARQDRRGAVGGWGRRLGAVSGPRRKIG
jgi:hypothetical protein